MLPSRILIYFVTKSLIGKTFFMRPFISHQFFFSCLLTLYMLILAPSTWAKNFQEPMCKKFNTLTIPAADLPTAEEKKALQGCSATNLYYGIGTPIDYVKARQCAFSKKNDQVDLLNDYDILAMIYANGQGIKKNLGLATQFACVNQIHFDPQCSNIESEPNTTTLFDHCSDEGLTGGFVMHIQPNDIQKLKKQTIDICDAFSAEGPYPQTEKTCADIKQGHRDTLLAEYAAQLTPAQQQAFTVLRTKANLFFDAEASDASSLENSNPAYPPGTSPAADYESTALETRETQLKEAFNNKLQTNLFDFEQGKYPQLAAAECKKQDDALNNLYSALIKTAKELDDKQRYPDDQPSQDDSSGSSEKEIQRAWLKYRDAFVQFSAARYPKMNPASLQARLTEERITQLANHRNSLAQFKEDLDNRDK